MRLDGVSDVPDGEFNVIYCIFLVRLKNKKPTTSVAGFKRGETY